MLVLRRSTMSVERTRGAQICQFRGHLANPDRAAPFPHADDERDRLRVLAYIARKVYRHSD